MKRTATEAFVPPAWEAFAKVSNYLTLYVALNPTQFAQLQEDQPILPDPCSQRFGLRDSKRQNVRTSSCRPSQDTAPEQIHIKKYMICKIVQASATCTFPFSSATTTAGMPLCTAECADEKISKILSTCFAGPKMSIQKSSRHVSLQSFVPHFFFRIAKWKGSTQNPFLHNERTKVSLNLQRVIKSAVPPKVRYAPSVCIASQSLMC